jgi:hypothetical protein
MQYRKFLIGFLLILPFLNSCKKDFSVNAEWKDITIVYGLLSHNDSVHYIKITKAFLGPGNAYDYAKIPDSSNYPAGELSVRLDEYDESSYLVRSIPFDTITLHTKDTGDIVFHKNFYYPNQLVYKSNAVLDQNNTYKLVIHNNKTGLEVTSQTNLVNNFSIIKPDPFAPEEKIVFIPNENTTVAWTSAVGGKRYQLIIRFHYNERPINNPAAAWTAKAIDWFVFSNELSRTTNGQEDMVKSIKGDAFYSFLAANIDTTTLLTRQAGLVDYIFNVASEDLTTYMEVNEPSTSIVQYRPPFTDIDNGIGLFSSRLVKSINSRRLGDYMVDSIRANPKTSNLGF